MAKGIVFNLGKETSSSNTVFKVEHGSNIFMNEIIAEEFANGYELIGISCDGDGLGFILFKKRGN